eukprot:SAG31_NODE_15423_length_756_cov_0.844749_1_plen_157_part_10
METSFHRAPTAADGTSLDLAAVDPSVADAGWPLGLRQHADGAIFLEDLERLKERELAAARDCQYRMAAQLHATWDCLRPKATLAVEDASPTDVEQQHAFFLENGFCVVSDVLSGNALHRAQSAWLRAQDETQREWEAAKQGGTGRASDNLKFENRNV